MTAERTSVPVGAEAGEAPEPQRPRRPSWDQTTLDDGKRGGSGGGAQGPGLGPAARIGRYSVLRELGRGGMGVTYVAYDEELGRRVVIKLVRYDIIGEQAQRRLRREARALARLQHPNVVAVHDVGRHESQTFIAMEFVAGDPLSAWLTDRPRSWREVLGVFRQVGEGLRAAHAAGIVHRDVKPDNVLVGDDGRVRVLDFGLAWFGGAGERRAGPATAPRAGGAAEGQLTQAGQLMGTLAYMAPEQLAREPADARSDQFSLCVSLFTALYRREPFAGATVGERLAAMRRGAIAPAPEGSPVPAWLRAVVVRGLAFDPAARWPSLDALLAALSDRPARPRARAFAVAAALALAGGALAARYAGARDRGAACGGGRAEIEEAWGAAQREAVERAVLATGVSYAAETWQRTAALLDRYADDWVVARAEACAVGAARGEPGGPFDRRVACLAQRRRSLRTLAGELARVDAASIAGAAVAAGNLPRIASCADPEPAGGRVAPPADPRAAAQLEALDAELDRAEQLFELGKYEEGQGAARAAAEAVGALGYPALEGRARVQLGRLQLALGAHEAGEASLKEGHMLARIAGDHEATLQAATQLVHLFGQLTARPEGADDWERHVRAELPWVSSEAQQASALNTLGALALVQGRHDQALALCGRALALWQRALGPDHPEGAKALTNLGLVFYARGEYRQAAEQHRRVAEARERALGGEHPGVAFALANLGGALYRQGEYAEAARQFGRALAIAERAWGAEHPYAADPPLTGLSLSYVGAGRAAEAVALAERGLAILAKGDAGPGGLAEARFALARALAAADREPRRALALARQARDAMRAAPAALSLVALDDVEAWLREREAGR
ncbi:MAG TPA: serine/threonine-protein kinase [Polyangiaceae bacterium]|nr:serine/threonine-protein kinase [Polyangiaceae bacterium]